MVFIPATNTLRITLEYTLNGNVVVNVFYLRKNAPILSVNLNTVAASLVSWYTTYVKPHVNSGLSLNKIILRDMTTANSATLDYIVNPAVVGAGVDAPLPANVAQVVTLRTGLSGRSYRGRVYMAGLGEAQVTGNDVNSTTSVGMATAWLNLNSFVTAQGFELVIASFRANGAPRANAVLTPVNSYFSAGRVDTQRRRLA